MKTTRFSCFAAFRWRGGLLAAMLLTVGCRDLSSDTRTVPPPVRGRVESQLVLSSENPAPGDPLVVLLHVQSGPDVRLVNSFTARIAYDTTRLHFERQEPSDDGALRVINPVIGEARAAGVAKDGFVDGKLIALRFTVIAPNATTGLRASFDELHALGREDLKRVSPSDHRVDGKLLK